MFAAARFTIPFVDNVFDCTTLYNLDHHFIHRRITMR